MILWDKSQFENSNADMYLQMKTFFWNICNSLFHKFLFVAKERPFQCNLCERAFMEKGHLNKHVQMVHEGQRPFPCEHCEKSFTRNTYLTAHVLGVHEGKKPYECDICHQGFSQKAHLKVIYFCFAMKKTQKS